jgi:hypothetical protein
VKPTSTTSFQPRIPSYPQEQARFAQELKEKDMEIQKLQELLKKAKASEEKAV